MRHKYIRKRDNGNYQVRLYTANTRFSFTSSSLKEVIRRRNEELGYNPDDITIVKSKPKVLLIDIETAPILAYVWGLYKQDININAIKEDWYILCFAYKWLEEDETQALSLLDFDNTRESEVNLIYRLKDLLDEADIVVAHNGDGFDIKRINAKFLEYDITQPSPYKTVDTLKVARQKFRITSNKLDYLSKFLHGPGKKGHSGFSLWTGCMDGNPDSWAKMIEYNKKDVDELERVYLRLRGWGSHPNVAHYYNDDELRCTSCGSTRLYKTKKIYNRVARYVGYKCVDCGRVMRERKMNGRTILAPG